MIGIIILNYINWKDTINCITSIFNSETNEPYHVYVIDNASPKEIEKAISDKLTDQRITLVQNGKNLGYAAGNNVGIKKALEDGCSAILITNNDVRFLKGSIEKLYYYLQKHDNVGIVGPKILDNNGNIQKSNICMHTGLKEKYLVRTRLNAIFRKLHTEYFGLNKDYNKEFIVYAVLGCCFMMSRECALEVTPLDENTFLYEEELILGIHMEEKGYKTVYFPESIIMHLHNQSTNNVRAFSFTCNINSEIYYCKKYLNASILIISPLYIYRVILYLIRCLKYSDFRKNLKYFINTTIKALLNEY